MCNFILFQQKAVHIPFSGGDHPQPSTSKDTTVALRNLVLSEKSEEFSFTTENENNQITKICQLEGTDTSKIINLNSDGGECDHSTHPNRLNMEYISNCTDLRELACIELILRQREADTMPDLIERANERSVSSNKITN